jgi:hypothetical protein
MIKPGKGDVVFDAPPDFDVNGTIEQALRDGMNVKQEGNQLIIEKGDRSFSAANNTIRTQRAARPDHNVAKMLLRVANEPKRPDVSPDGFKSHAGPLRNPASEVDDRALIDHVHEATFTDPVGLQWIKDKYDLRMMLRRAHCFTLDRDTSRMVADFSVAIAADLEAARPLAIPPFPVTWIEIDNTARLDRVKELGIKLTKTAAGETEAGPAVERTGWLISPDPRVNGAHFARYFTRLDEGVCTGPMAFWWNVISPSPNDEVNLDQAHHWMRALTFGVRHANVHPYDACLSAHDDKIRESDLVLMQELAGELRHIWGFLIALGAGQLGVESKFTPQTKPKMTPPTMKNGKPLLPLEHKTLHLHLAKRSTVEKVIARAVTHHKNREHDVRAHFRILKNEDGTVRKRVPVKSHKRGDDRIGVIEKTYVVER